MRRFNSPPHQPRRGQALLLAVVIMIFAALLSASFIAIVSVNLNQTARQTDKNRAIVSAQAGMDFVKKQLAYSDDGERWKPLGAASNDGVYYNALDRAQGWSADTDNDGFGDYAKYPDPRNESGISAGPQFLTKVEKIPTDIAPANPEFDKAGSVRITVIGLSPEDPSAYSRSVAYFGGYKNSPVAQAMRVVSNWDFKKNVVPVALSAADTTASTTLTVTNANSDFSQIPVPFTVTISKPSNNPTAAIAARGAVVTNVTGASPNYTLTLAAMASVKAGERVEMAANLGAPIDIDYTNSGVARITFDAVASNDIRFRFSDGITARATTNQLDSSRINGGLLLSGDLLATKLRPATASFGADTPTFGVNGLEQPAPGAAFVSGVVALDGASPKVTFAKTNEAVSPAQVLKPSDQAGIFAPGSTPDYSVISDGWNALIGTSGSNTRNVTSFQPPVIDSGAGVERYRNLSRFSKPYPATLSAAASLYGYGQGIYIDNVQDRERVYATVEPDTNNDGTLDATEDVNGDNFRETKTGYREMRQSEIIKMWLSPAATTSQEKFVRSPLNTVTIPASNVATASLEEQHLRGWVGPDEFRARGVEIEVASNKDYDPNLPGNQPGLVITRDSRTDNTPTILNNATGPDADKVWKNNTGAPIDGTYRIELPWPDNGVIFAEGNVRIKGSAIGAPRSLTVISMNNIYIEDSLQLLPPTPPLPIGYKERKILLMARKNVVMNPTRVLARPDAQTITTSAKTVAIGTGQTLDVADGLSFKLGDFIQASTVALGVETPIVRGYVTANPTQTSVTFTALTGGAVPTQALVRTPNAATKYAISTLVPTKSVAFDSIANPQDVLQRRLNLPATTTLANLRLSLNHQATRIGALTVGVTNVPTGAFTSPVLFSNKGVFTAPAPATAPFLNGSANAIAQGEKAFRADYTDPTAGTDNFPGAVPSNPSAPPTPASEIEARGATHSIGAFATALTATDHVGVGPNPPSWKFSAPAPSAVNAGMPFFYLAGVSNRLDFPLVTTTPYIGTGLEKRPDIRAAPYEIPLATSIGVFSNGAQTPVYNENWNTTLMRFDIANQFGFSPTYINTGDASEDVLTGDQSFYQNDVVAGTLDSRQIANGLVAGSNSIFLRQSDDLVQLTPAITLPEYRLEGLKVENVEQVGSSAINSIGSGHDFNVNAFVYAQTGSWFVIPGGFFDDRIKTITTGTATNTFLDVNNDNAAQAGESIPDGMTGNSFPDLNRNGIVDPAEKYALARYSRYNYQINFTGAIAENQTALVNDAGTGATAVKGAVASWMDKWATTSLTAGAITNDRIHYVFDPTVVLDNFQKDDPSTLAVEPTDTGFRLPQVPQVFNVS